MAFKLDAGLSLLDEPVVILGQTGGQFGCAGTRRSKILHSRQELELELRWLFTERGENS
jgi:hypothetical protein